jgi:hypothetical protein
MSNPNDILLQIQTQLKASSNLSYVDDNKIFLGIRSNFDDYPIICIEPILLTDLHGDVTLVQYLKMKVALLAYVSIDTGDQDESIADTSLDSMLKLENDIKIALDNDITLGGLVYDLNYTQSTYDISNYPLRGVQMEIELSFKQLSKTRT